VLASLLQQEEELFRMIATRVTMLRDKGNLKQGHVYFLAQKYADELIKSGEAELFKQPGPSETKING
jgi:hypothetical protein